MVCPRCGRPLRPLFISVVCDYCDGLVIEDGWDRGWVVWRGRPIMTCWPISLQRAVELRSCSPSHAS